MTLLTVDLDRLDVRRGDRLLDAGCGEGRHCFGALERGANAVGLDLDLSALRMARGALAERARQLGQTGRVLQGNVFELPFEDGTFDKVICSEVMEHVHDFAGACRELARVVRPGGRIAVTIPTATSEHLYLRLGDDYFESPGGHIRIFRPRRLARGLAAAGFAVEDVSFAHGLHTPYWVLRSIAGLPEADRSGLVRLYRWLLIRATASPSMDWFEQRVLNYICPKSLVLYGTLQTRPSRRVAA